MDGPIEVVIARRKKPAREHVATVLLLAAYVLAMKVVEDVQTGAWQHSTLRLRMVGARDRVRSFRDDARATAEFRSSVHDTIDRIEEYVPQHTEEV